MPQVKAEFREPIGKDMGDVVTAKLEEPTKRGAKGRASS
jgi:hypothetical protein